MTRALPKEDREKIVKAFNSGTSTARQLAKIFGITVRWVHHYVKLERDTGDLTPRKQPGKEKIVTDELLNKIRQIIIDNPDGTLDEHRFELQKQTKILIGNSTMSEACTKLNFNRKKKVFMQRNKIGKT